MNDSGNSYLELIMPSPVRGYNRSFLLLEKTKKRKRDHSSSVDAQTRAKMFQNSYFLPKKPIILQIELNFSFDELIFPRIILLICAYFTFLYEF